MRLIGAHAALSIAGLDWVLILMYIAAGRRKGTDVGDQETGAWKRESGYGPFWMTGANAGTSDWGSSAAL